MNGPPGARACNNLSRNRFGDFRAWCAAALFVAGIGCAPGTPTLLDQIKQSAAEQRVKSGDDLLAENRLDEALKDFDAAVQLHPRLAIAHSKIGRVRRKKGQLAEAARAFAEAIRIDPLDFLSTLSLGQIYQMLAASAGERVETLRMAVRAYQRACELRPDHFEAHLNLGVCYHQLGDFDQAIEFYQAALKIDPQNAFAYANLGAAYDSRGNYYDAIRMYKNALEAGSDQPMV